MPLEKQRVYPSSCMITPLIDLFDFHTVCFAFSFASYWQSFYVNGERPQLRSSSMRNIKQSASSIQARFTSIPVWTVDANYCQFCWSIGRPSDFDGSLYE